jgi:hypothetical protein
MVPVSVALDTAGHGGTKAGPEKDVPMTLRFNVNWDGVYRRVALAVKTVAKRRPKLSRRGSPDVDA